MNIISLGDGIQIRNFVKNRKTKIICSIVSLASITLYNGLSFWLTVAEVRLTVDKEAKERVMLCG